MPNSPDFRSDQIQVNKLIVSGANAGSTECLLVYPLSAQGTPNNQGNINPAIFDTSPIGSDAFFYVSGSVGGKGGSTPSIVVFGGDLHVSGNLSVDGSGASGGSAQIWFSDISGSTYSTGSVQIRNEFVGEISLVVTGSSVIAGIGSYATGSSVASGEETVASGLCSHSEGQYGVASGDYSHSEGYNSTASGNHSHAEGFATTASGAGGHSEGDGTLASGINSHAEGVGSSTSGIYSHAEGYYTSTNGPASHTTGWQTVANGSGSFAAGLGTIAEGETAGNLNPTTTQAAFGKYNIQDASSLFVVGDGDSSFNRHDVFRVTSGSVQVTGSFEVLGGITGSLSGTTNGNPFLVGNPGITANYNSSGQWELSASSKIPILAGVVTTTLSASTIAGYALFTDLNSPSYTLEGIGFASVAGVTGSLELYDLVNSSSLSSLSWTETTPMHKTASFVATGSSRVLELRVNKSGGSISDYALFSAVFFG